MRAGRVGGVAACLLVLAPACVGSGPPAERSAAELRSLIATSQSKVHGLYVVYSSKMDRPGQDAPRGAYLHRVVAATSAGDFYHLSAHGREGLPWQEDYLQQRCTVSGGRWFNANPVNRTYSEGTLKPTDPLPGSAQREFIFAATGIWPFRHRPAPAWIEPGSPYALREVAVSPLYSFVRPYKERLDGRWCHVLERPGKDRLWLDAGRGAALLAREYTDAKGAVMQRFELGGHEEASPDVWVPRWIRNIHFDHEADTSEGRSRRLKDVFLPISEFRVSSQPEGLFAFEPPPGALKLTAAAPEQVRPGGIDHLDDLAAWVDSHGKRVTPAPGRRPYLWVGLAILALVAAGEGWRYGSARRGACRRGGAQATLAQAVR